MKQGQKNGSILRMGIVIASCLLMVIMLRFLILRTKSGEVLRKRSPDGNRTVVVEELNNQLVDHNLIISIQDEGTGNKKTIFKTPDEGKPSGTEKIFWSDDGDFLLLVGKNFFVVDEAMVNDETALYLMYRVSTGEVWCNSSQTRSIRFVLDDVIKAGIKVRF